MRFVADECCHSEVVARLRAEGHDVLAVREATPGASDPAVVAPANDQNRILLTEDLDFGELAVRRGMVRTAVILLRLGSADASFKSARIRTLLETAGARIAGRYVVVEHERFRFRRL